MKLVALFSGGKDSTYSIYQAQKQGHTIECLLTIFPKSDESMMLHYPNIHFTKLQSTSMRMPQIYIEANTVDKEHELSLIEKGLKKAIEDYKIEGMVHGGILSEYQRKNFEKACSNLHLELISPLWQKDQFQYMKELIESNFHFIISSVSSDGLDESWLGKEITLDDLQTLNQLSKKHGFNLSFEGGEAETLVIDCPLFSYPIFIENMKKNWDGIRGRFEIEEAKLNYNAR